MSFISRMKKAVKLFADAGEAFIEDDAFKLAASLSYYTVFALGPLLIIIISLAGIFFGKEAVQGKVYLELRDLIGSEPALQVQQIITNIQASQLSNTGAVIGVIILIIGATGVFTEMQGSINYIWSVKAKPKKGWLKFLTNRLLSFSLIVGMGFILLVSLVINALLNLLSDKLMEIFPKYTVSLFHTINSAILMVVITVLFAIIYKVLPDALISWKDAFIGAIVTAALFLIGKTLIGYYVSKSSMGITYGTAASIIIILSWIYYSAMILYYGAEFTKMYALHAGHGIRPNETAVFIIKSESKEVPQSYLDT